MRIKTIALAGCFLAACLSRVDASDLLLEKLSGRGRIGVNDFANVIPDNQERQINDMIIELRQKSGAEIAVVTLQSLEGGQIDDFTNRLFEQWGVGQKGKDNGLMFLAAMQEREMRIEVGYGLEGRLTDLAAGRIIRNVIVPRFKSGQVDQGVIDGVQAMAGVVRGEFSAAEAPPRGNQNRPPGNVFFGLMLALFILNVLGRLRRSLGALAGAVIVPIIGTAVFGFSLVLLLVLIPVGIAAGLLASFLGAPLVFGSSGHRRGGGGFWIGGGGGMGGGGFGGFSGGGGGFGGGGASGGW